MHSDRRQNPVSLNFSAQRTTLSAYLHSYVITTYGKSRSKEGTQMAKKHRKSKVVDVKAAAATNVQGC
jgi:hypothetical protein